MRVTVKDNEAMARDWGRPGGGGVILLVGEIADTCPTCSGPRGEVRGYNGVQDGEHYHVDVWTNPCGHVDQYENVVREIRARAGSAA